MGRDSLKMGFGCFHVWRSLAVLLSVLRGMREDTLPPKLWSSANCAIEYVFACGFCHAAFAMRGLNRRVGKVGILPDYDMYRQKCKLTSV